MVHTKSLKNIIIIISLLLTLSKENIPQSFRCGIEWYNIQQVSNDSILSISPQLALTSDRIHIIWFGIDTLGFQDHDGIQYSRSDDNGISFRPPITLAPGTSAFSPGKITASGNYVYVTYTGLVDGSFGTALIRSVDNGETWEPPRILLLRTQPLLINSSGSMAIIHYIDILGEYGLSRSNDYGSTWLKTNPSIPLMNNIYIKDEELHAVGIVDLGRHDEVGYYYSIDGGVSWIGPDIISSEDIISSLYPKISIFDDGTRIITWNDNGNIIIRSSNGYDEEEGELMWEAPKIIYSGKNAIFPEIATQQNSAIVVWDLKDSNSNVIQYRQIIDNGKSLCDSMTDMIDMSGEPSIKIHGTDVHLFWSGESETGREIFYRRGKIMPDTLPTATALKQNYPNPANEITRIDYDIARPGDVRLELYNLLGVKIMTLVNEFKEHDRYIKDLNCSNLPTGVYFYRLTTRYSTETRKMVIVH